jgi:tRNA (cytidine/uridine-2'-O-)-methyltransferase
MDLAFYQPEIPQNTGTLMRFAACMGRPLHIIHPCGFVFSDKKLQRASMDYRDLAQVHFHDSWEDFVSSMASRRLILLTPDAPQTYVNFTFEIGDCLILGQESCGFPESVIQSIPLSVRIPMVPGVRSLNVAIAGAMIFSEALRQTQLLPKEV